MTLCCGEALIDKLPLAIPGEGQAFVRFAGGAMANNALAIAHELWGRALA